MRVAVVQFAAEIDSAANSAVIDQMLTRLADERGHALDLVVLPEASMRDFGSPDDDLRPSAQELKGLFFDVLSRHARSLDATIIAGMFERDGTSSDAYPFNTLIVVNADGEMAARYRKIHLYDSFGYRESERLQAGDIEFVTVDIAGVRCGLMTCYDLRFPEMARALIDEGSELIIAPSAWVAGEKKLDHWKTLVGARAIENTVPVIAAAQSAPRYTGHSLAIDAAGTVLAEAGDAPDILVVDLDTADTERIRRANPSLDNRRMGKVN